MLSSTCICWQAPVQGIRPHPLLRTLLSRSHVSGALMGYRVKVRLLFSQQSVKFTAIVMKVFDGGFEVHNIFLEWLLRVEIMRKCKK